MAALYMMANSITVQKYSVGLAPGLQLHKKPKHLQHLLKRRTKKNA